MESDNSPELQHSIKKIFNNLFLMTKFKFFSYILKQEYLVTLSCLEALIV